MNKILRNFFVTALAIMSLNAMGQAVVTFDASVDKGTHDAQNPGADQVSKNGITVAISNGAMNLTDQYRCYKNATLTVTSTEGNIAKVEFTCVGENDESYGPGSITDPTTGTYTFEGKIGTWTGDAESFTMTASKRQIRFNKIVVTLSGGVTVEEWKASSLTFDSETQILQEAVKTENKGAGYSIPAEANIFPIGTWQKANDTGDISPVTDWLAAQSNPSTYAIALKEYTFTASTASVSMKAVSTPNADSEERESWQKDERTNMVLNTEECPIKWNRYVKPKTGNPSLGYYDFYDAKEDGGSSYRVYDDLWKIGCGKLPGKGTYYEFTFAKAGSMIMGVYLNRPNQSAVVVVDKETLNPLPYTALSFEGFCQNNTYKYPSGDAESTDPTFQKFNFREDYTIDVSAQPGRALLGYLSFPVEAKTYLVFQPSSQVGIYGFQFTPGGDPSGVETIKTNKVWNADAPMYNLSGQKVDKSYKGIVIQNGRKFFNK